MVRWERYIVYPLFIAALFLGVGNIGSVLEGAIAAELFEGQNYILQDAQRYEHYVVQIYRKDNLTYGLFEIHHRGVRVWSERSHSFCIGIPDWVKERVGKAVEQPSIGEDITGDGQPNLVIYEGTGNNLQPSNLHVFEIGDEFRFIQTIWLGDSLPYFENVDEDEALELLTSDYSTFVYWPTGMRPGSPAPEVILKYQGGKYTIACELMRKPKLAAEELAQLADEIKASSDWDWILKPKDTFPSPALYMPMIDLIYTGNMDQAWELYELACRDDFDNKEQFANDLKEKLTHSPYWENIQRMNLVEGPGADIDFTGTDANAECTASDVSYGRHNMVVWDLKTGEEVSPQDLPRTSSECPIVEQTTDSSHIKLIRADKYYADSYFGVMTGTFLFLLAENISDHAVRGVELSIRVVTADGYDLVELSPSCARTATGHLDQPSWVAPGELLMFGAFVSGDKGIFDDIHVLKCSISISDRGTAVSEPLAIDALRFSGSGWSGYYKVGVKLCNHGTHVIELVISRFAAVDSSGQIVGMTGFVISQAYWNDGSIINPLFDHVPILPGRTREIDSIDITAFADNARYLIGHVWSEP
jgi:hypothetical protein